MAFEGEQARVGDGRSERPTRQPAPPGGRRGGCAGRLRRGAGRRAERPGASGAAHKILQQAAPLAETGCVHPAAAILVCIECGLATDRSERGWRSWLTAEENDEPVEAVVCCPG